MGVKESALTTVAETSASDFVRVVTSDGKSRKVSASEIKVLELTKNSVSSLPATISDSRITANHVVINSVLSNPAAQTGDWTVTTSAGSLSIAGSISGTTNITLYLAKKA